MYYPLSKITTDLYTSGKELCNKLTKQDYRGYYFSTFDGKFFSEKTPLPTSVELIKYKVEPSLSNNSNLPQSENLTSIGYHHPSPTESDYSKGYITRYFVKRVNGDMSTVREISQEDYNTVSKDPLYVSTSLTWVIKGKLSPSYIGNQVVLSGVLNINDAAIKIAEKVVPGISFILLNLAQFHK